MASETCAKCDQPMTCGHLLGIDQGRASWRLCCLCTGELLASLQPEQVTRT